MQQTGSDYQTKHLSVPVRTALMVALLVAALFLVPALVAHADDFTVNNVGDIGDNNPGDGNCNAGGNVCTLRAAIQEANALAGHDNILFSLPPAATITLNNGELLVDSALTISGPGADDLTVSGNTASRVIRSTGNVTITGVTITDGAVNGFGGGIYNAGQMILSDCVVTDNEVTGALNGGGGIFNTDGTLTINRCTISNNTVPLGADDGGGILTFTGTLTLNNSYVTGNTAADAGGGVRANYLTTVYINNTTIADNTAGTSGGGFRTYNPGSMAYIVNSTISGNTASNGPGGGVFVSNTTATITNTTISSNTANTGAGGLYGDPFRPTTVYVANSIVAGNGTVYTTTVAGPDIGGTITSRDYNLVQVVSGGILTGTVTNTITDTAPLLGPLADNGGDTLTYALLTGSPAINQIPNGVNGCGTTITADQRGVSRPQGVACDIGAFEAYAAMAVTKSVDDASPDPGQLVAFVITVDNTDILPITNVVVSDSLPAGLTFAGPVTLEGASGSVATGTVANDAGDLPVLASGFAVDAGERVTVTFPVTVNTGQAGGTSITNVAAVTSTEISMPNSDAVTLVVNEVAPTAMDDSDTVLEDHSITIDALANDVDLNGDTLSLTAVGTPDNGGTATIAAGEIQYTPAADFNGTETFSYTVSDGVATGTALVTMVVTPVNDAPSFTPGPNQFVMENAGAQSVANWATNISPGAANESGQTLTFAVSNDNNALFSVQPALNAVNGTLMFTPAPDATGTAVVTVVLEDDGGVANGGEDTSAPVTFTIRVLQEGTAAVQVTKTAVGPGGNTVDLELGDIVTYTITLENAVATVANGVMMTDVLPTGVTFGEWLEQGSAILATGGNTIQWGPHDIPGNTSFSISFTAVLPTAQNSAGRTIVNTAVFSSDNGGTGSDDAVVTIAGGHRIFLPMVFRASP